MTTLDLMKMVEGMAGWAWQTSWHASVLIALVLVLHRLLLDVYASGGSQQRILEAPSI